MVRRWTPEELAALREREGRYRTYIVRDNKIVECFNHRKWYNIYYWTKLEILEAGNNYMCKECMVELGLLW